MFQINAHSFLLLTLNIDNDIYKTVNKTNGKCSYLDFVTTIYVNMWATISFIKKIFICDVSV